MGLLEAVESFGCASQAGIHDRDVERIGQRVLPQLVEDSLGFLFFGGVRQT